MSESSQPFGEVPLCQYCGSYHYGLCPQYTFYYQPSSNNFKIENLLKEILEELRGLREIVDKQSGD